VIGHAVLQSVGHENGRSRQQINSGPAQTLQVEGSAGAKRPQSMGHKDEKGKQNNEDRNRTLIQDESVENKNTGRDEMVVL
jgi:hypothetical protein